jgi:DNA-binding CsgD family transcriptional regulator
MAEYWVGTLVSLGRWEEAEHVHDDLGELLAEMDEHEPLHFMAMAWTRQGRLDRARPTVEHIRRLLAEPDFWIEQLGELAGFVLEFDAADHRCEDPVSFVDDILRRTVDNDGRNGWWLLASAFSALADHAVGIESDIELADVAARWIAVAESRPATLAGEDELVRERVYAELGRLQRRSDAAEWTKIADGYAQFGFRYDEALARYRAAEALLSGVAGRSLGAHHDAFTALQRSRSLAEHLPAPPLLRKIRTLAASARMNLDSVAVESSSPSPADALGLTHREADVLELVAAGMSNGDIGQRLFISRKTASVHVTNILRKLGVSNRIEAAGILHRISLESDGAASANGFHSG